ncbi:holin [Dermabacteraceae bacterium P13115]
MSICIYADKAYWVAVVERAVKRFSEALAALVGAGGMGLFDVNWGQAISVAGMAAVVSVLTSLASTDVGMPGTSLVSEGRRGRRARREKTSVIDED